MLKPQQKMRSIDKHNYGTLAIEIDPEQKYPASWRAESSFDLLQ